MKLHLNLLTFQKEFLSPLLEMNKDGRVSIQIRNDKLVSIVKSASDAILLSEYTPILIDEVDNMDKFHINLSRLEKGIKCVKSENFSQFCIEKNYLEYKAFFCLMKFL